ncbi:MAG: hypothetical protein CME62_10055 [Halobacteriovoraceae bacterium]|nr:hypothetical protein [Halobacteriovoraceae bacterium]|tara:strand:+ start:535 stop:804 length:270 start_codon:yes stop_codon:yes gene_type:complete
MKILAQLFSILIVVCLSLAIQLPSNVIVENVESSFNVPFEEEVKHETKVIASLESFELTYQNIFYSTLETSIKYIPLEVITPPPDQFSV